MGCLFPPPDEPLASGFDDLMTALEDLKDATPRSVVGAALLGVTLFDLCPDNKKKTADPPQENHAPVAYRVQPTSVSSTSGQVPFFGNTFDAADVAIRAGHARRNST